MAHDHRFIAQIVAPPAVDRPVGEAAARAVQLFSVASQGVNNLTKVPTIVNSAQNTKQLSPHVRFSSPSPPTASTT